MEASLAKMLKYLIEWLPNVNVLSGYIQCTEMLRLEKVCEDHLLVKIDDVEALQRIDLPHLIPSELKTDCQIVCKDHDTYVLRLRFPSTKKPIVWLDNTADNNRWNRIYLNELKRFSFHCLRCKQCLLSSNENCNRVNDMPSEYWAELMDYWHCHKPTDGDNATAFVTNGSRYGQLNPREGELLVGGSFVMVNHETIGKYVNTEQDGRVLCQNCNHQIGTVAKDNNNNLRLDKWLITLKTSDEEPFEIFPPEDDITLALLNYTKGYSGRYMLLKCSGFPDRLVWIFSFGTDVVLTKNYSLMSAMKLLWTEDVDLITKIHKTQTVEVLNVRQEPYECFQAQCRHTQDSLPIECQQFQDWQTTFMAA